MDLDGLDAVDDIAAVCLSRPTTRPGTSSPTRRSSGWGRSRAPRGVPLILDTAYGAPFPGIVFGEATPVWNENTVVCMSLSKLGLPGFRTGIVIANEEIIDALAAATAVYWPVAGAGLVPCSPPG